MTEATQLALNHIDERLLIGAKLDENTYLAIQEVCKAFRGLHDDVDKLDRAEESLAELQGIVERTKVQGSLVYRTEQEAKIRKLESVNHYLREQNIRLGESIETQLKRTHLETSIKGHMEAMRPLLNEWSETK